LISCSSQNKDKSLIDAEIFIDKEVLLINDIKCCVQGDIYYWTVEDKINLTKIQALKNVDSIIFRIAEDKITFKGESILSSDLNGEYPRFYYDHNKKTLSNFKVNNKSGYFPLLLPKSPPQKIIDIMTNFQSCK
jgi:hypothetical protein